MKRTYSTSEAAKKIGVVLRTINRWLADGKIRPSVAVPMGGGRTLWRWTAEDVQKARRVKAAQKPGPNPGAKRGAK